MAEKRKRGQNFSLEEKDKLIKLLLVHKDTILNKKTDGATNEAKHKAWIAVTNSFNSSSNTHRNKESLMKVWENMKSDSKIYYSKMRRNTTGTGGGPSLVKIDPVLEQVCSIFGLGCTGILEVSDSEAETGLEAERALPKEKTMIVTKAEELGILEDRKTPQNYNTLLRATTQAPTIMHCDTGEISPAEETQVHNKQEPQSRRRLQLSNSTKQTEASSLVSSSISNICNRKERIDDLKVKILQEKLEFKRKLYDLQLQAEVKNVEIKTEILQNIKESECKKRWRSLRDSFIKLQRTHGGRTRWPYHHAMRFLLPHVEPKDGSLYSKREVEDSSDPEEELVRQIPQVIQNQRVVPSMPSITSMPSMPSLPDLSFREDSIQEDEDSTPSPKRVRLNSTEEENSCHCNRNDPDELFLLSCAPILKRLNSKQNAVARLKIQQVLYEAEFGIQSELPYVTPGSECGYDNNESQVE